MSRAVDGQGPPAGIPPGQLLLGTEEIDQLILAPRGRVLHFPSIDRHIGNRAEPLAFRKFSLFAAGARTIAIDDTSQREIRRATRDFYIARSTTRAIGLAVDRASGHVHGFSVQAGERMQIRGNFVSGLEFAGIEENEDANNTCASDAGMQIADEPGLSEAGAFDSQSAALAGESLTYQAVVAVETDSAWLAGLADDPVAAQTWIADAFLAMNVFFERDVETRLLVGDVFLRIGTDPYSASSDRYRQLNEFGEYWSDRMGQVERQFALKLSGRGVSSYSFSGIAWIDAYCEYGRPANGGDDTYGSYSLNAVGSSRSAADTALYLGHELGHNLGSPHTHCYNPPIDQCYNGAGGCYSGTPQCPAAGRGTIMSYCHVGGSNGAGCGTSFSEFHPTVQSRLEGRLASEVAAGCIDLYSEPVPEPELVAAPQPGALFDFQEQLLGSASVAAVIQLSNLGDGDLTLACGLSGTGSPSFEILACPALVSPSAQADIRLRCAPAGLGTQYATLELTSNDADESALYWSLLCTGIEDDPVNLIFSDGFD